MDHRLNDMRSLGGANRSAYCSATSVRTGSANLI
jgi:hypothetical protein